MAEDLVSSAITHLQSLYKHELDLFHFVNEEIKNLESNLSTIKAVLEDAEKKRLHETSQSLSDWMQKLKDVVYVLDDILDDCSTEVIRDKFEGVRSCNTFLSFLHPRKIIFRHSISDRMRDIKGRLDCINREKNDFHFLLTVTEKDTNQNVLRWRQTTSVAEDGICGRDEDKENILERLLGDDCKEENLSVLPIVGIGGIGKTTLAQLVYNDNRVDDHFDIKIWICVSENFDLEILVKAIIASVKGPNQTLDPLSILVPRLQVLLHGKRYLLVLDDIWNDDLEKWNQFRSILTCGLKGSVILTTTREKKIATIMRTPLMQPYCLIALSKDDCWQVFKRRAFGFAVQETEKLSDIGKEIALKCKGVPLAAKTLGGLLSLKSDEESWVRVKDSNLWDLKRGEDPITASLRLSYLNLPSRLRRCFAYCAVFPKDYKISKENLVHLWMANGIISHVGTSFEVEDLGDEMVRELYWRSLIQDIERDFFGNIKSFKMHDFVHDLAQSIMGDESHVVHESSKTKLPLKTRHLSVCYNVSQSSNSSQELVEELESLRTLINLRGGRFVPLSLMGHICLRALDLTNVQELRELPTSIHILKHLRYLNLSHTKLEALPDSICSLWNLQILNLQWCEDLKRLPKSIGRLISLRHLSMIGCFSLISLPSSIAQLTSLRTLDMVIVGEDCVQSFQLSQLGRFHYLSGTLQIMGLERVTGVEQAQEANLSQKQNLNELHLTWGRSQSDQHQAQAQKLILEALRPPSNLKILVLSDFPNLEFLPDWFCDLSSVEEVRLYDWPKLKSLPTSIQGLPRLRNMAIVGCQELKLRCENETDEDWHKIAHLHNLLMF